MLIHQIVEARDWVKLTGSQSNRVWFDTKTGRAITANDDGNHSLSVYKNPDLFGLTGNDWSQYGFQPGEKVHDYDGRVLYPAMQNGWVRIFIDYRQPDYGSNAEGCTAGQLRRALLWYCEHIGQPKQFTLVFRHGHGDKEGVAERLKDQEAIEWFLRKGTIPRERFQEPQQTQVRQMNTTPHMFRNVTV